jgi:hypothetical protein
MKGGGIQRLSNEELWVLHQKLTATLKPKIVAEKRVR